jgi:triphosphoribosyl-dephospho-CoA synthetase
VLRGYPHNGANPGTTADLTAAAIFVSVMHGGWDAR